MAIPTLAILLMLCYTYSCYTYTYYCYTWGGTMRPSAQSAAGLVKACENPSSTNSHGKYE